MWPVLAKQGTSLQRHLTDLSQSIRSILSICKGRAIGYYLKPVRCRWQLLPCYSRAAGHTCFNHRCNTMYAFVKAATGGKIIY